jgi:1,4-dihydroxy-2-naphthoyl-CoA hydrolase
MFMRGSFTLDRGEVATDRGPRTGVSDDEALRARLLDVSPFDRHYGLEIVEASDELVRGRVPVRGHVTQPTGLVHGGVHAAIAEALASLGTNHGVVAEGNVALGMSNSCSFLRPIAGGTIEGTARRRHRGRTTWLWDVELTDDQGRLCAVGRVTVAVRPAP